MFHTSLTHLATHPSATRTQSVILYFSLNFNTNYPALFYLQAEASTYRPSKRRKLDIDDAAYLHKMGIRCKLLAVATVAASLGVQGFTPSSASRSLSVSALSTRQAPTWTSYSSTSTTSRLNALRKEEQILETTAMHGGNGLLEEIQPDHIYESAIQRTIYWVAAAGLFGAGLVAIFGSETGEEFFAGYLLEQSLSIDNLLVFLLLFEYFKIPLDCQDRVLNWGIIGAIVMRAVMIGAGAVALQQFHAVLLGFAAILIYSSAKVLLDSDSEEEEEDLSQNQIVQFSRKMIASTDKFDGDRFFTLIDGVKTATPLLLCMVAVEISDVVFAVDSIPAVFGVTEVRLLIQVLLFYTGTSLHNDL